MGLFFKRKPKQQASRIERREILQKYMVEIQRRPQRRQTLLMVEPRGEIVVKCALTTPSRDIERLLITHEAWLKENLKKALEYQRKFPLKDFADGEIFPLLGKDLTLKLRVGKVWRVRKETSHLVVEVPQNFKQLYPTPRDLRQEGMIQIGKYYKKVGVEILGQRLSEWAEKTELRPKKVTFRNQRTLWGSCNTKAHISLNWKMVAFPQEIYDYILVHELCHIRHPNHSSKFWAHVERFLPDYKGRRLWLRENQNLVDFLGQ